jgi:hypothetical protein
MCYENDLMCHKSISKINWCTPVVKQDNEINEVLIFFINMSIYISLCISWLIL